MEQTIIQIGNSAGVIIPQAMRKEAGIEPGDKVLLEKNGNQIVLSKSKKTLTGDVDVKFMQMLDEFINEHEDALRELAKR